MDRLPLEWRFYRFLDIQKLLFAFFYDKEVAISLLYSTFAFEQGFWKSQNLCQFTRMRLVGSEDMTFFFYTRIDFLAFHNVLVLLSRLDFNLFFQAFHR